MGDLLVSAFICHICLHIEVPLMSFLLVYFLLVYFVLAYFSVVYFPFVYFLLMSFSVGIFFCWCILY